LRAEEMGVGGDATELHTDTTLLSASRWQLQEEDEEEEDDLEVAVEEEEDAGREGSGQAVCVPVVQRGWGGEEVEEEEEEMASDPSGGGSDIMPIQSLAHMAEFMLGCFCQDTRVARILENKVYWVFALLDPRYKENVSSFIPVEERTNRLLEYQRELIQNLMEIFPPSIAGGREERVSQSPTTTIRATASKGTLSKVWDTFMAPPRATSITAGPATSRRDKYRRMLREYLADRTPVLPDPSASYTYWVSKLDTWLELSLYALEVLACPAASVLSERVFSAAGGIVTDKRSRLSTDSADRLTLIKMNSKWIDPDFASPTVESSQK